jgi:osmoprotectant transport system permease protein
MINQMWQWLTAPEQWTGSRGIPTRLLEHLGFSALSLVLAAAIAIPLGLWSGHTGRGRAVVTGANAARAVPSLGLLFAVAMFVGPRISSNLAFVIPSVVVLVLLAIPPLLSGADSGVRSVDPAVRDAAYGMGMTGPEVLRQVELPCALPLLLSGVRAATLQVIATATIAAAVSLGGLGRYLIDGLAVNDYAQMAGGALLVAALALGVDGLLALTQGLLVSPGLTSRPSRPWRRLPSHSRHGKFPRSGGVAGGRGRVLAPAALTTHGRDLT